MLVHICELHALQILKNFTMINLKKKQNKTNISRVMNQKKVVLENKCYTHTYWSELYNTSVSQAGLYRYFSSPCMEQEFL